MIKSNDNKYVGELGKAMKFDEKHSVEIPFMEQLRAQGWDEGDNEVLMLELGQTPANSYRHSF